MKLLMVTTRKDRSRERLVEEAEKRGMEVSQVYYEDLEGEGLDKEDFSDYGFCILRDPYNTGKDFSGTMRSIMSFFSKDHLLDFYAYSRHPRYEDKLFQHELFGGIMKMPTIIDHDSIGERLPVIAKKRISSRGRDVFILKKNSEIRSLFREDSMNDYLFEKPIRVKNDGRVLVAGNEIIGAVDRRFRIKNNRGYEGVGVRVRGEYILSDELKGKAIEISERMESDFCGIDFLVDEDGQAYLLECNVSPQFVAFEKALGINVAGKIIDLIVSRMK